jgi:hypothetical protein
MIGYGRQGGYPDRYLYLPMRRTFFLISAGVALILAGVVWMASAQPEGGKLIVPPVEVHPPTKVDINQAGLEELTRLPGITPVLAERIAKHRPYRKLDDLVTQKVLGKKQFARIRDFIVVLHPKNP